jgi:transcriptional regulator with XRE-family HTH domain
LGCKGEEELEISPAGRGIWFEGATQMDALELKKWRKALGLSQSQAAEKLGVQRSTFQNWEHERVPIPQTTELACETVTKQWNQRSEFGPVILVYADRHIWPGPEGKHETRMVQCEFYNNNETALTRVRLLASRSMLHNPAILDPDGGVLWSTPELLRESTQDKPVTTVQHGTALRDTVVPGTAWWKLLYGSKVISGRVIKAARTLLGWSKAKLAHESGVSTWTIAQLERAHLAGKAHSRTAQKLRHALEVGDIEFIDNNGSVQGIRLGGREVRFVGPNNET